MCSRDVSVRWLFTLAVEATKVNRTTKHLNVSTIALDTAVQPGATVHSTDRRLLNCAPWQLIDVLSLSPRGQADAT